MEATGNGTNVAESTTVGLSHQPPSASGQDGSCSGDCGQGSTTGSHPDVSDQGETCTGDCAGTNSVQPATSGSSSSTREPTCSDQCAEAETSCSEGELRVCEADTNGCLIWSGATDCDSGFCADEQSCLDTPTCNGTNQDDCPCEDDETRPCRGEGSTCEGSIQTCEDGAWSECSILPATEDTCELGNDANCNGEKNEGCPCVDGDTQDCGNPAVGICKMGTQTCQDKVWGDCVGEVKPKARDCSSSADNDCDGTPDHTIDNVCKCAMGATQACNEHPDHDVNPPCQAGSQSCELATDKASSKWSTCTGDVGPAPADTCEPENDANCNGERNEGCACVNGMQMNCQCGGTVTCANGVMPSCAQLPVTRYRDGDNDGFGNPNNASMVCPSESGWVINNNDCDDDNESIYPNSAATCAADQVTSQRCPSTGGMLENQSCSEGCFNGLCRTDGTIGLPNFVSCQQTDPLTHCPASLGCDAYDTTCGTAASPGTVRCDGPNDCPGQVCCAQAGSFSLNATCADVCTGEEEQVCDPLANTCQCLPFRVGGEVGFYTCPL